MKKKFPQTLIFAVCVSLINFSCLGYDLCGNHIANEVVSPNGKTKAIIFERSCGATTGFSTQISVLPSGKNMPNENGNVFYATDNDRKAKLNKDFVLEKLEVKWLSETELLIRYDNQAKATEFEKPPSGIKVIYEKLP